MTASPPLLQVEDLHQQFGSVRALEGVSVTLDRGQTLGVVGESGSGKTTLGRAALRLYVPTSGRVLFDGHDVTNARGRDLIAHLRRKSSMVFQNPTTSLNPQLRLQEILAEALRPVGGRRQDHIDRARQMLTVVGLPEYFGTRFPHELSGGQRQRVGIARALIVDPLLIVADEPTASLDVSVQAQVVNLLADLQTERGLAYLFISHDLELVQHLSDRIVVLYLGRVVERGEADDIFSAPLHPYTTALASMHLEPRDRIVLAGDPPSPSSPPSGCVFHPRCPIARALCRTQVPELMTVRPGRAVACHFPGELELPADPDAARIRIPAPLPDSSKEQ